MTLLPPTARAATVIISRAAGLAACLFVGWYGVWVVAGSFNMASQATGHDRGEKIQTVDAAVLPHLGRGYFRPTSQLIALLWPIRNAECMRAGSLPGPDGAGREVPQITGLTMPIRQPMAALLPRLRATVTRAPGNHSLNYLVGAGEDRRPDGQSERVGGLEVDDEIKLGAPPADRPALAP